ncbi:YvcK family protein [Candidatus Berkelbacteria bacterium]|nr:YvcK family protein [Candidatus Berkelbacteria bacterium]
MTPRPRIVVIGGGTGLATVLRGLKNYPVSVSAIVTMTDNGASSGRLSREMGVLPPGDIRKCLAALSNDEQLLTKVFEYRFKQGRGLAGHSLGNLLLLALSDITGDFEKAVEASSKILSIKGEVIPSTLEHVSLLSKLKNGALALGEVDTAIQGHRFGIEKVIIQPENVKVNPTAAHFIKNADLIIAGPGSFYTSVIPNFLIEELKNAVANSHAKKIYICNASTERGETEGYSVEDHFVEFEKYAGENVFDTILVNNRIISESNNEGKLGSIKNISTDSAKIKGATVILADLIDEKQPLFHDHKKLAKTIWESLTTA